MGLAEQLYGAMGPFADADTTGELEAFIQALAKPAELVDVVVGEDTQEFGWSITLDADRCPVELLPWLAQWDGVTLTPNMTEIQRRQAIKDREGAARGRPATIRARVERTLTGTKRIVIRERTPGPYNLYIRTWASETPDATVVEKAILDQKPAGLTLDYAAAVGSTYIDLAADYATYGDLAGAGVTYQQVAETLP